MSKQFVLLRQGAELNLINKMKIQYLEQKTRNGKEAKMLIPDTIEMEISDRALLTATARRYLDMLVIQLTENSNNKNVVYLPLEKYMKLLGIKDKYNARRQMFRDMKALDAVQFKFLERSASKLVGKGVLRISGGFFKLIGDTAFFTFSEPFYNLLKKYPIMNFDTNAFRLDVNKYPNAYQISRFLDLNYNMNSQKASLPSVSVKTLLDECSQIPTLEKAGRKWRERIVQPFFRDLDAVGAKYSFVNKKGQSLDKCKVALEDFLSGKLIFDYTEHRELIGNPRRKTENIEE